MVNPLRYLTDSPHIYEQALSDFGITELMEKLSNFSDSDRNASWMNLETSELESLATILIRGLTLSLKGKLIASYVNTQVASYPRDRTSSHLQTIHHRSK